VPTSSEFVALCRSQVALLTRTGSGFEHCAEELVGGDPSQADSDSGLSRDSCGVGGSNALRLLPEKGDTVPRLSGTSPEMTSAAVSLPSAQPVMNAGTDEYQPNESNHSPAAERANRFAADA